MSTSIPLRRITSNNGCSNTLAHPNEPQTALVADCYAQGCEEEHPCAWVSQVTGNSRKGWAALWSSRPLPTRTVVGGFRTFRRRCFEDLDHHPRVSKYTSQLLNQSFLHARSHRGVFLKALIISILRHHRCHNSSTHH
jgi:hypothetical protein